MVDLEKLLALYPGVPTLIPGSSSLSNETLSRDPVSIGETLNTNSHTRALFVSMYVL